MMDKKIDIKCSRPEILKLLNTGFMITHRVFYEKKYTGEILISKRVNIVDHKERIVCNATMVFIDMFKLCPTQKELERYRVGCCYPSIEIWRDEIKRLVDNYKYGPYGLSEVEFVYYCFILDKKLHWSYVYA